jgi:hypothetical protein
MKPRIHKLVSFLERPARRSKHDRESVANDIANSLASFWMFVRRDVLAAFG